MNSEGLDVAPVPEPKWGLPMQYRMDAGTHVVRAEAPGLFRSPPAWRLLLLGVAVLSLGLFTIGGAAIGCLRDADLGGLFAFLIGGGVGAGIAWLGVAGLRWGAAAAWGTTEITLTPEEMRILRISPIRWEVVIPWADFRCTTVTDQFGIAHELLVLAKGHRVVRVLSGRSIEELGWLALLIGARRGDEADPDEAA